MSCRHICRQLNLQPQKQRCFDTTSNPKPSFIFHSTHHYPFLKFIPSIFPIVAIHTSCNIYIVMFVIIVHCPLPGSSRFFLSFIKKHHKNFLWCRCSVSRKFHCHHDGSCTNGIVSAIPL